MRTSAKWWRINLKAVSPQLKHTAQQFHLGGVSGHMSHHVNFREGFPGEVLLIVRGMIKAGFATSLAFHTNINPRASCISLKSHVAVRSLSDSHIFLEDYTIYFPQFYASVFAAEDDMSFSSHRILHGVSDMRLIFQGRLSEWLA